MKKPFQNPIVRGGVSIIVICAAALLLLPELARGIFSDEGFMPHACCYQYNPRMIWLHVVSDLFIGLAYVSISATLAYLVYRARREIPFHWMFLAFGLFIVSCGFTHFMEIYTVWHPMYWLAGCVKVVTGAASVVTAVALFPLVPKIFQMMESVKISEDRRVKLAAANDELEAFASTISHDLRAPLRAMQGLATALKQDFGPELPAGAVGYTNRIIDASVRMDNLIQDLLAYSRINLGEFQLESVDLKSVVDETNRMLAPMILERNATVEVTGTFPAVRGNRALALQAISNLVTNALKFTAPGTVPRVTIDGRIVGARLRLAVSDSGIGIAPEYHERIFKMFERLHTATEYPGTGVGLAIVQRAVARMGGALGMESELGKGSRFWIELQPE